MDARHNIQVQSIKASRTRGSASRWSRGRLSPPHKLNAKEYTRTSPNERGQVIAKSSGRAIDFWRKRYNTLLDGKCQTGSEPPGLHTYRWCSKQDLTSPLSLRPSPPEVNSVFALLRSRGASLLFFLLLTSEDSLLTSSCLSPNWMGESDSNS